MLCSNNVVIYLSIYLFSHSYIFIFFKVMIKGVSNHLGFGAVGLGVPDRIMEFQVNMFVYLFFLFIY